MNQNQFAALRWATLALAITLSFLGWATALRWQFDALNIYRVFPLLGLIAFSVMATHFILLAAKTRFKGIPHDPNYSFVSGYIVLICLLFHPGLIIWKLWVDGYGLPPKSYAVYVGSEYVFLVYLGVIALLTFLAYEAIQQWAKKAFIVKNWFYIILSQIVAMVFVFVHATQLGFINGYGWYKYIWYLQGLLFLVSAGLIIVNELKKLRLADKKD
jgi:hypothetical protein